MADEPIDLPIALLASAVADLTFAVSLLRSEIDTIRSGKIHRNELALILAGQPSFSKAFDEKIDECLRELREALEASKRG